MTPVNASQDHGSPIQRDYSSDARVLFIAFSGLRRAPKERPGFSFIHITGALPAKKLFVRDLTKAWYLRGLPGISRSVADTTEFFRSEIAAVGAERVVVVGYSLGGFAAMLYGTLLDADEVHAFSPQTFVSLRQRIRYGDHRWNRYALKLPLTTPRAYRDLRPVLERSSASTRHHVYFAEDSRLDVLHARHIEGLRDVTFHPFKEGRHRLVTALRDSGELLKIFESAVANQSASGVSRR